MRPLPPKAVQIWNSGTVAIAKEAHARLVAAAASGNVSANRYVVGRSNWLNASLIGAHHSLKTARPPTYYMPHGLTTRAGTANMVDSIDRLMRRQTEYGERTMEWDGKE
jgi:hypothetical protein